MEENPATAPNLEPRENAPDSTAAQPAQTPLALKKLVALCVVCSVCASLASVCGYQRFSREPQVRIMKYDLAGYKERLVTNILAGRIPKEEFDPRLSETFAKIAAAPPGIMVITADVALRNIPDYMPLDIPEVAPPQQSAPEGLK